MNTDLIPVYTPTTEAALRAGYADSRRRLMNGVKRAPVKPVQIEKPKPTSRWPDVPHVNTGSGAVHNGQPIETFYRLIFTKSRPRPPEAIIQQVLREYPDVTYEDLVGPRRFANIIRPRQEAMYRIHKERGDSYPTIGRFFGGRDHTTVMSAVKKIERMKRG